MSNLNKKILLFVMFVGLTLGLVGCNNPDNSVRIRFPEEQYEIRMNETKVIEPTIIKSSQVGDVELAYSSSDENVVKVVDGVLVPVAIGEAVVKVEWANRDIIFDKVTVKVIKAALPQAVLNYQTSMLKNDVQTVSVSLGNNLTEAAYTINALTPEIATVEGDVITAVAVGEAKFEVVVADYEETETYVFNVKVEESDFKVIYDLAGGVNHSENPAGYNALELPLPLKEATKEGYTFLGWYHNEEKVEAVPAGTLGDYEVVAKWQLNEYEIAYTGIEGAKFAEGYELPSVYSVESEEIVFGAPAKDGYTFLGWYAGEEKVEKIAAGSTGDVAIEAKWEAIEYSISYDLAGGSVESSYVYDESAAIKSFDITRYGTYNVQGHEVSLRTVTSNVSWWGHVALKATADPEIFEIVEIVSRPKFITVEFDYVIAWHSACTDANALSALDSMLDNAADYVGDYMVITGIPAEEGAATISAKVYDKADVEYQSGLTETFTCEDEFKLNAPVRPGYEFLGWYAGEEKVEKVEKGTIEDLSFVAKWEIVEYMINYDAAGGDIGVKLYTYETIRSEFLADFNAIAGTSLDAAGFAKGSSSAIKVVMANAEFLTKWAWFFEFAIADLKEAYPDATSAYLTDVYPALEESLKGESAIFTGSGGANARTMIRNYIGGMLQSQKGCSSNTTFQAYATDFSDAARQAALVAAANAGSEFKYTVEEEVELVVPTLFDHIFLGWYNEAGEKVEKIAKGSTGNITLTAKWHKIVRYTLTWNLEGGAWIEGQEGAELFVEGEYASVVLPTPVNKYHEFLGWYNAAGEKVEALTADQDYELTAKWKDLRIDGGTQYILFQLEGGNWKEGQVPGVDVTDYVEVLKLIPVKLGYEFKEWVVETDNDTEPVTVIYTAVWNEVQTYTITYVLNEGVNAESNPTQYYGSQLPLTLAPATKEGYAFLGWFDGETLVETITEAADLTLEARWEATSVEITFDLAGGEMEGTEAEFAAVAAELLADFNRIADTSLDAAGFAKGSGSAIKVVMANAEFLTKWAWFFEFAIADLKAANPDATSAYLTDVYPALEESLKGESAIFTGSAGPNARTMFRNYMGGLFLHSKGCPSNTEFQKFATDFSDAARQAALAAAAPKNYTFEYQVGDTLPVPTKAGYVFKGWYDANEQLVEEATAAGTLTAKWEEEVAGPYAISYDLAEGAWPTVAPSSHAEIKALFLADMLAYLQSLGQVVDSIDPVDQKEEHLTDFFGISYAKRDDIPAFFLTHEVYSARWKWMYDYVATVSGADLTNSTVLRSNIHGFAYATIKEKWPVSYDFSAVSFGDYAANVPAILAVASQAPAEYAYGSVVELPTPVKEGYVFKGWTLNGEAFEGITETTKGDLALVAVWEVEVLGPYTISYDLAGGAWGAAAPTSHEEIKTLFLADMLAYLQSLGQVVESIDPVDQKEEHLTDFFGISYAKRDDIPAFFLTHEVYSARWKWMYDYVATASGADLTNSTVLRSNIHGFVYSTIKEKWPVSYDFSAVSFGDYAANVPASLGTPKAGPAEYAYGVALELPTPVLEGKTFAGWTLNGVAFEGITETTKGDLVLVATWA